MLIQFSGCGDKQGKKFILAIALTPNTKQYDDSTQIDRALHTKYQIDVCGTIKVKLMINLSKINTID
jgi:hypothetical protein